jgi:RNA recognition motif. (a.k.a. RRM, RBD, or RNP domain)
LSPFFRDISIKNGYAFIDFDDHRDADDAVYDLHRTEFMGEMVSKIAIVLIEFFFTKIRCDDVNIKAVESVGFEG